MKIVGYTCRQCGAKNSAAVPEPGMTYHADSSEPVKRQAGRIVVRCPKCGAENAIPIKG